jgi:hypothetical protein
MSSQMDEQDVDKLAPAFHEKIEVEGGVFAAGIGWSAVVVSGRRDAAATPVRLTELHWAYYALYMEIDRGLLGVLNQQQWSQPARLKQLEADAAAVFADYLRVMDARARLDSALSALGGDELAIWEVIAKVQRFDVIVDAVQRKLDVLDKVAQRRVEQATADRTRRVSDILGALTVLSVVTVTVAVLGSILGSNDGGGIGSMWLRIGVVFGALTAACSVYWVAFVRTTRVVARVGSGRRRKP